MSTINLGPNGGIPPTEEQKENIRTALSVPALDANGNLTLGTATGDMDTAVYDGQNPSEDSFWVQNMKQIGWRKADGITRGAYCYYWQNHDADGNGELIVSSPGGYAIIGTMRVQFGNNASWRDTQYLQLVSGASTVTDTLRASKALMFRSSTWDAIGGHADAASIGMQAVPLNDDGERVLRIYDGAECYGEPTTSGSTAENTGDLKGTLISELHVDGEWNNGIAPTYQTLTAVANVFTQVCSKYRTIQVAKLTLGDTNTIALSGAVEGMRGVVYVTQPAAGSKTLALPDTSAIPSTWSEGLADLSTTGLSVTRLEWEFDGQFIYWTSAKDLRIPMLAESTAFFTRASISDDTQKNAINTFVSTLKGASLWEKFYAIYPFVGGNSTAHSKNLIADEYNITDSGSWATGGVTHDADGITGVVASSGYGDTNFNFAAESNRDDASIYVYCKTHAPTATAYLFAAKSMLGSDYTYFGMYCSNGGTGNHLLGVYGPHNKGAGPGANTDVGLDAHLVIQRSGENSWQGIVDSDWRSQTNAALFTPIEDDLFLLARNNDGSASGYSNANLAMAAIGQALTESQWAIFRAAVDVYQAALSRANA